MRLSVASRRPGGVGQPPRQAAGHYGEWPNWANALEQPPAGLRGGLRGGPQISVRSLASRKAALCTPDLTESRTLQPHLTESRTLGVSPSRRSTLCTPDLT